MWKTPTKMPLQQLWSGPWAASTWSVYFLWYVKVECSVTLGMIMNEVITVVKMRSPVSAMMSKEKKSNYAIWRKLEYLENQIFWVLILWSEYLNGATFHIFLSPENVSYLSLPTLRMTFWQNRDKIAWSSLNFRQAELALYLIVCKYVCQGSATPDQISTFFNKYWRWSPILALFHQVPSSTNLYWPNTTKYQPILPHTYPVESSTN